ncbi:MAG: DExD/H-box ATP-dependent RNA helicase dhh1 [Chaenotheca gracillima]|nr:MAG: DExD/H-box ATP-dependent RNA helicase dhh1 [Chaenotheca gracillima]
MASGGHRTTISIPSSLELSDDYGSLGTTERLASLRRRCLGRDHRRCVITRRLDQVWANKRMRSDPNALDLEGNIIAQSINQLTTVEVAHIMPHSTNAFEGNEDLCREQKFLRDLLNMFDPDVLSLLEGAEVDHPRNAITLAADTHDLFGRLEVALEPDPTAAEGEQKYRIPDYTRAPVNRFPPQSTFFGDSREHRASARLLILHAACAKMCHLCGAGEYVERLMREFERTHAKADGSSNLGAMIEARLSGMQIMAC